jgi:hypothetical protein
MSHPLVRALLGEDNPGWPTPRRLNRWKVAWLDTRPKNKPCSEYVIASSSEEAIRLAIPQSRDLFQNPRNGQWHPATQEEVDHYVKTFKFDTTPLEPAGPGDKIRMNGTLSKPGDSDHRDADATW